MELLLGLLGHIHHTTQTELIILGNAPMQELTTILTEMNPILKTICLNSF